MIGECDNYSEHALECNCGSFSRRQENGLEPRCNSDPIINAASHLIAMSIYETQIKLALATIEKAGLLKEFKEFYSQKPDQIIFDAMKEFAVLHPDKFYVPKPSMD